MALSLQDVPYQGLDYKAWQGDVKKLPLEEEWLTTFLGFPEKTFKMANPAEYNTKVSRILEKSMMYYPENGSLWTPAGHYHAGWFVAPSVKEILEYVEMIKTRGLGPPGRLEVEIVEHQDISSLIKEGPSFGVYQVASQFNALEIPHPGVKPSQGISAYPLDKSQGFVAACTTVPGTLVRNYWLPHKYGGSFSALDPLGLTDVNGYLIWGTDPSSTLNLLAAGDLNDILIPAMIYTQVMGVCTGSDDPQNLEGFKASKLVHQIFSSSAPFNTYGNGGSEQLQLEIIEKILEAEYTGAIGLAIILKVQDGLLGIPFDNAVNLTLVGDGALKNPMNVISKALLKALNKFKDVPLKIKIHDSTGEHSNFLKEHVVAPLFPQIIPAIPGMGPHGNPIVEAPKDIREVIPANPFEEDELIVEGYLAGRMTNDEIYARSKNILQMRDILLNKGLDMEEVKKIKECYRYNLPIIPSRDGNYDIGRIRYPDDNNLYLRMELDDGVKFFKPRYWQIQMIRSLYHSITSYMIYDVGFGAHRVYAEMTKKIVDKTPVFKYRNDRNLTVIVYDMEIHGDPQDPCRLIDRVEPDQQMGGAYLLYDKDGKLLG